MKPAAIALLAIALGFALACPQAERLCQVCPPIEGRYQLALGAGADTGNCSGLGVRADGGELVLTRTGSALEATFQGVGLSGTLVESGEFSLAGDQTSADGGALESTSLSGQYWAGGSADGGALLTGNYDHTVRAHTPSGDQSCIQSRSFTAERF